MGDVVDGSLKVYPMKSAIISTTLTVVSKGVRGLRVADASIMPYVTTGNTNAPSMMIGKKAAILIKKDRRLHNNCDRTL